MVDNETLDYTLTREAYKAYNLYYLDNSPSLKRVRLIGQFVPPLVVMAAAGVLYLLSLMTATNACLLSGITYAVFMFLYPVLFRNTVRRRLAGMLDEGAGQEFIGEHRLELMPESLRDTISGNVVEIPYRNLQRQVENDGHLYLFIGPTVAFVIPVAAMGGKEGKMAFLARLVERGAPLSLS